MKECTSCLQREILAQTKESQDSARDFCADERFESEVIPGVLRAFKSAQMHKKIRPKA